MVAVYAAALPLLDIPMPRQINFQTPANEIMEKIVDLHHDIMFFLVVIIVFVSYIMYAIIKYFGLQNRSSLRVSFSHHTLLEKVWTYIPTVILILIAAPSFSLLYDIDALTQPKVTIKVIGNQ